LGEILWDRLPSGPVLGGAPANFAYMASVLGDRGIVASRIGTDPLGGKTQQQLRHLCLTTDYLQQDAEHQTGTAEVSLDSMGQPTFTITESVAWDYFHWTNEWKQLAAQADVICYGSLAQRSALSAGTIDQFLHHSRPDALRIFDVNLRQSYYDAEILKRSLRYSDIAKLSDQELISVARSLRLKEADEAQLAGTLLQECELKLVCVTRGAHGSLLVSRDECVYHPGFPVNVVDSIGAGDAFTACLAHYFLRGHSLKEISGYANRFASWVATQTGATPPIQPQQVQDLLQNHLAQGRVYPARGSVQ